MILWTVIFMPWLHLDLPPHYGYCTILIDSKIHCLLEKNQLRMPTPVAAGPSVPMEGRVDSQDRLEQGFQARHVDWMSLIH